MIPPEGQLQALYEIPSEPAFVAEVPMGDPGRPAYDAYVTASKAYAASIVRWAAAFRPVTGLTKEQHADEGLADLARMARALVAEELVDINPKAGEASNSFTDAASNTHTARALPQSVLQTAIAYLVRALFFAGVSKADAHWWNTADKLVDHRDENAALDTPNAQQIGDRQLGPAGTNAVLTQSGALRLIQPFVRRGLSEVTFS